MTGQDRTVYLTIYLSIYTHGVLVSSGLGLGVSRSGISFGRIGNLGKLELEKGLGR